MNVAPWFQSLIGKLQTTEHLFVNPLDIEFQSLIGKLQTYLWWANWRGKQEFQSLIGKLQTSGAGGPTKETLHSFNPS